MKPEATRFLVKASNLLSQADVMLDAGLNDVAGRTAYLAGFHAAQAFIFERTSRAAKTHNGVHSEFLRLTKNDPAVLDPELRSFLSVTYNLKAIADCETGSDAVISPNAPHGGAEVAQAGAGRGHSG